MHTHHDQCGMKELDNHAYVDDKHISNTAYAHSTFPVDASLYGLEQ